MVKQLHYEQKRGYTNKSGVVCRWCDIEGIDRVKKIEEGKIFYLRKCVSVCQDLCSSMDINLWSCLNVWGCIGIAFMAI